MTKENIINDKNQLVDKKLVQKRGLDIGYQQKCRTHMRDCNPYHSVTV